MNYYTYIYIDPVKNIPRYVGYGHGNRAYSHLVKTHNKSFAGWLKNLKDVALAPIIIKEEVRSKEEAKMLEIFWISIYGRKDKGTGCLFNHTNGGDGGSGRIYSHSDETKKKMSETRKGKKTWIIGKTHTEETKKKMSDSRIGDQNAFFGKCHKEETKQKQSTIMTGRLVGENNPFYGKKHPPELQKQINEKLRGKKKTPEEIARRNETRRRNKLDK